MLQLQHYQQILKHIRIWQLNGCNKGEVDTLEVGAGGDVLTIQ